MFLPYAGCTIDTAENGVDSAPAEIVTFPPKNTSRSHEYDRVSKSLLTPAETVHANMLEAISLESLTEFLEFGHSNLRICGSPKECLQVCFVLLCLRRVTLGGEWFVRFKKVRHIDFGFQGGSNNICALLCLREVSTSNQY